jgi:hypothetical protein
MIEILFPSLGTLIGTGLVVIGLVALIDPIKYAKLHVRFSGRLGVPFWARDQFDPVLLAESRDMRNQWRLMGAGFIVGGGIFVNAGLRSLAALLNSN